MRWEEWRFSAKRAIQDPFVRWTTVGTVVLYVGISVLYLVRVLPDAWRSGVTVLHFNVYLGIDDVRSWPWAFTVPGFALGMLLLDVLLALGFHRQDTHASRTIVAIGALSMAIWATATVFLILVNA
ncbi:hypothetical protein KJ781_01170 [Patescibacteria group bacterium]|nr:hypothetical protein [Patescibacteria group bacterium]MBU1448633.1 hypothetical protein [Patescibacteria group bacterium]MBU2613087.1 hypothetical protein [Patescibacteria group bacterium]